MKPSSLLPRRFFPPSELNGKIDGIMNEMNVKETHNKNLYNIRTSEDAQKQINAINKAKENIQNMGKLKINIK